MRKAPKALRTSDVARPRTLLLSAVGAAAGVSIAVAAEGTPLSTPRPIARPHAKLGCASCHGEATSTPAPAAVCKTCHGGSHASTRAGHQKMIAKGEMTCLTCHKQHAGAQGVTFDDGRVVRWGASAEVIVPRQNGTIARGTTVPLVATTACAKCHDLTRASDPVSACVPARRTGADAGAPKDVSLCFDEHARVRETHPSSGKEVCAKQHDAARFIAWDAAADVAATTPWVATPKKEGTPWVPAGGALAGALALGTASTLLERRRRRAADGPVAKSPAVPAAVKKLPVINPSTCLGCYACVDACPFDVLTIEKYVAVVARPEECCGVVLCEQVCPNGSLQVAEGEPILDRPATDDALESKDVPGLFLAGDLTGLPLIKNAINQGVRAVDRIAATLGRRERAQGRTDVLVIGAGPAGLSAALRAKEKDLSCVVVEQATVAASIKSFPRDKIVHDPPLDLPVEGELWLEQATKEELLAQWTRIVRARALDVREGHRVVDVARTSDRFVVTAEHDGRQVTFEAARVIFAIGRRGTPRRLEAAIDPAAIDHVFYALADARSFEGKKVLVVGLGDSAMEAAIALARQPSTTVTVTYRGSSFARGKAKNIRQLEQLVAEKKVKLLFETTPVSITPTATVLETAGPHKGRRTLATDAVLVLIGGVPSWDLLERAGIRRPR
ncbi:MAG: NAD(P)-binding domain-containing protein [Labilithrix sp.]|nr:NAD(P)-binding domain-containing protein [Labilithrix sp.]MCW5816562.1 NAD(P)-binding domain-containing protein [Labilithrix sp.]